MCLAILDAMPFGGGRIERLLAGRGRAHIYMVYVGVGWAMARLPRSRWHRLHAPDPLLRWLVLDGYGFHQAYFRTDRYVHRRFRHDGFPWPADGPAWYANRAIDQGVGRAMWFVGGGDARTVAGLIDRFPEDRRPDLYGGAGLAASYAGGADETELRWFLRHAGQFAPQVAQGAVFAATARVHAGLVVPHTERAARVFCGMTPQQAADLADRERPDSVETRAHRADPAGTPAYEAWRQRIAGVFVPV